LHIFLDGVLIFGDKLPFDRYAFFLDEFGRRLVGAVGEPGFLASADHVCHPDVFVFDILVVFGWR
jgi:hypothetical protein